MEHKFRCKGSLPGSPNLDILYSFYFLCKVVQIQSETCSHMSFRRLFCIDLQGHRHNVEGCDQFFFNNIWSLEKVL